MGHCDDSRLLVFRVDREEYAFPLMSVREVATLIPGQIIPVPHSLPFVTGIINLRGKIVTLVDLVHVLSDPAGGDQETTANGRRQRQWERAHHALVLDSADLAVGVMAEEVPGVLGDDDALTRDPPESDARFVRALIRSGTRPGRLVQLLDVEPLLTAIRDSHRRREH